MDKVNLSIILTMHSEGLLAHKTMRSVFQAIKPLQSHKISYEIIIHVDNGTLDTLKYLKRYATDKTITIYKNSFGDPGSSRNFAIEKAKGEYISLLDGDDLVSPNWFIDSYQQAKNSSSPILVHPEANLTFGPDIKSQTLWVQHDSFNKATDAILSVSVNRWISTVTGLKQIFLDHPYFKIGKGFGNEDYWFNTETLADDICHKVAPRTVQFYRRKREASVFTANLHSIQPYSKLLDIKQFNSLEYTPPDPSTTGQSLYNHGKNIYTKLRQNHKLDRLLTPIAYRTVNYIKRHQKYNVPDYVISEWKDASKIESMLYPTEDRLRALVNYDSDTHLYIGNLYKDLVKDIDTLPNYIFIVPWVVAGGADKVLINYLKAFAEIHPKWKIAVITTEQADNKWQSHLPENTYFIDYGNAIKNLSYKEDRDILFSRILVQLRAKKLHIINSEYGYNWISDHKEFIKDNHYIVNVSLFCHDIIPGTNGQGVFDYANPYLLDIYPLVNNVFTDNQAVIDNVVKLNGFDSSKFITQYQPIDIDFRSPHQNVTSSDGKFHILWASRIASQKHPELLKEISQKINPAKYQIDVYGRLDSGYRKDFFDDCPAISYHGAYNGINSLDLDQFGVFLYTSLIDGLPNILLEIAALGLPIISSDVGGIKEFIKNEKTGILITNQDKPDFYIKAIHQAKEHPETFYQYAISAQKLLLKKHSFSAYLKKIAEDF